MRISTHSGILVVLVAYLAGKLVAGIGPIWMALVRLNQMIGKDWWKASFQVAAAIQRTGKICGQYQSERDDQHGRAGQRVALGRMVVQYPGGRVLQDRTGGHQSDDHADQSIHQHNLPGDHPFHHAKSMETVEDLCCAG